MFVTHIYALKQRAPDTPSWQVKRWKVELLRPGTELGVEFLSAALVMSEPDYRNLLLSLTLIG